MLCVIASSRRRRRRVGSQQHVRVCPSTAFPRPPALCLALGFLLRRSIVVYHCTSGRAAASQGVAIYCTVFDTSYSTGPLHRSIGSNRIVSDRIFRFPKRRRRRRLRRRQQQQQASKRHRAARQLLALQLGIRYCPSNERGNQSIN